MACACKPCLTVACGRSRADSLTRRAAPPATIPESDCAFVLAGGRRIAVLTEPPPDALVRVVPALRAFGGARAAAADAAILLGPGSMICDLSFSPCRGMTEILADTVVDDLAVAAALAARPGDRLLAEPAVLVAALPGSDLLHLVPPLRWWHRTWLVRRRDRTVRIAARLLFRGGLVLG